MSSTKKDLLALVARIIIGGIFITAGWMKVADMASTIGFFATLGLPAFLAYIVGYLELIGGIMVVLGLCACKAEGILAIIMVFAIGYSYPMGLQGFMAPLALLGGLFALVAAGDGKYAIKSYMKKGGEAAVG